MEDHGKAVAYALAACMLWGTVYVAIRTGLAHGMHPLTFAGVRFLASGLMLLGLTAWMGKLRFTRRELWKLSVLGLFQTGIQNAFFFTGVKLTSAGVSAIFINTQPFFVILLAPFFFPGSRITPLRLVGLAMGFAGVMLTVSGPGGLPEGYGLGIAMLVLAALTWAGSNIAAKKLMVGRDAMAVTAVQMSAGAAPLLAAGLLFEGPFMAGADGTAWLVLAYLAVFATSIPFYAWYKALSVGEVGRVSVFAFVLPVLGVVSGWLLLGEPMGAKVFFGMLLVASGIAVVNLSGGRGYFRNLFSPSR